MVNHNDGDPAAAPVGDQSAPARVPEFDLSYSEAAWEDLGPDDYTPDYTPEDTFHGEGGDHGYDDDQSAGGSFPGFRSHRSSGTAAKPRVGGPGFVPVAVIVSTLREVLSAFHGRPAEELRAMVGQVRVSTSVLDSLTDELRDVYRGVLEVLEFETANLSRTAIIALDDLPAATNHTDRVIAELAAMATLAHEHKAASTFRALVEAVQAARARSLYQAAIDTVDAKATADEKMEAHKAIIPPTTQGAATQANGVRTAAQLVEEHIASRETSSGLVYSSGLLTVDMAFTAPGDPLHFIAPGEQTVIAGPTGTGKSSLQYSLTRNAAQDEINWGYPDAPVLLAHTEEESWVKAKAMGLFPGQRWHHLATKIVIENIGSSRRRLVEMVYDLVIAAMDKAQNTARPIQDFLPRIGFLDYIQSVTERGETDVQANITTAELILRGFQAFNPE